MEEIGGIRIDDSDALTREGRDISDICLKLCTNYMKQILDDGFFHADPHPGNLRVVGDRIVFLDLGMVGRLSARDQAAFEKALSGVAARDARSVTDAVIAITRPTKPVDSAALHEDVKNMLDRYLEMDIGQMNIGNIVQEYLRIAQKHGLKLPQGVTLLGRGISTLEGVVADLSPETNLLQIVAQRFARKKFKEINWKEMLAKNAQAVYESAQKSLSTPALLNDTLRAALEGNLTVRVETAPSAAARREEKRRESRLIRTIALSGLFSGSCLLTLSNITPRIFGLPWIAAAGFGAAALYGLYCLARTRRDRE